MRLLPLFASLLILVSCGKNNDMPATTAPEGGPAAAQREEEASACVLESCHIIQGDGTVVELLDSIVDAKAEVSDSQISFIDSKISVAEGEKFACKTEVRAGDVFSYALSGNKLNLSTPQGNYTMTKLNTDGSGIIGTWMWKGKVDPGMLVIRTLSVVSNSRVILKTHCEL